MTPPLLIKQAVPPKGVLGGIQRGKGALERVKSFAFDRGAAPNLPLAVFFGSFLFRKRKERKKAFPSAETNPLLTKQKSTLSQKQPLC